MEKGRKFDHGIEDVYIVNQASYTRELIRISQCGITYPYKNYLEQRNRSMTMCIEYVESGAGVICADNNRFYPVGGDTYMLHINENQKYWADPENPWKKYWVNLNGITCKKLIDVYKLGSSHHFPGLNIKDELAALIDLAKERGGDNTSSYLEILHRIFFKMYEYNISVNHSNPASKIRDYIDIHVSEPFSLSDIQNTFGKSESQIIRIFKTEYGITPYAYHLEKRIESAKNLLTDSKLRIKDIADCLNFYDEYYFSNIFLKKTGLTPSQFRKQGKE